MKIPMILIDGSIIDLANVHPSEISIEVIAHSLAYQCRFTGHTKFHYSVAQHSYYCSYQSDDPIIQKQALLHDCSEALFGDVHSIFKQEFPKYIDYENSFMSEFYAMHNLPKVEHPDYRQTYVSY